MANLITASRIVLSIIMIFTRVFSPAFYICYLLAGLSDMIDGTVARILKTDSKIGERFDTLADIVFVVIAFIKILPVIELSRGILIWIGIILLIKIINIVSGYVMHRQFVTVHSVANKLTGILLFALPLTLAIIPLKYSAIVVCSMATFAAVQEGHFIRTKK